MSGNAIDGGRALPPDALQATVLPREDVLEPRALHEVVDLTARRTPLVLAVVDAEGQLTYQELQRSSEELAAALLHRGLETVSPRPLATLMRRDCNWMVAYIATARCGVPALPLSGDLTDKATEQARNREALQALCPQLLLIDRARPTSANPDTLLAASSFGVDVVDRRELLQAFHKVTSSLTVSWPHVGEDALLAYCFTGGTTKASKVVKINHAMALHEAGRYCEVLPIDLVGEGMRFLQNSSAYWGAALLGQLDVPLATGGAAVLCVANLPAEVVDAIVRFEVTCFGAVPSVLAHFSPADVPRVRCVISWAEDLPDAVAAVWRGKVPLRDLLIATEYWLCLYSTREGGDRCLRPVGGVDLLVVSVEDGQLVGPAEVGEMCLGGATVCPGYADPALDEDRFVDIGGRRYFRTRDMVRWVVPGQRLEYCGRCDDMVKVGGKWVDVTALEAILLRVPGVREVKLVFGTERRHAFLVLGAQNGDASQDLSPGRTLDAVRRELPVGVLVHVMAGQSLPRHAVTGKVDRKALLKAVEGEDLAPILAARRGRVLHTFARSYLAVARMCRFEPARMLCLAFVWYALLFTSAHREVAAQLDKFFPQQGGARGVALGLAWALPLPQLKRLASVGVAYARAAGRGFDWAVVFWVAIPYWLPSSERGKRIPVDSAANSAVGALQALGVKWASRACGSCSGTYVVSVYPSLRHCCNACGQTDGASHGSECLRRPVQGWRKCDNCTFACTWNVRFCCFSCQNNPGQHGPRCDRQEMDAPLCGEAEAMGEEESSAPNVEAAPQDAEAWSQLDSAADEREQQQQGGGACGCQGSDAARPPQATTLPRNGEEEAEEEEEEEEENEDQGSASVTIDEEAIAATVAQVTECVGNSGAATFRPLDSLRALRLLAAIRRDFGRSLSLRDLQDCTSVADLVARVLAAPSLPAGGSRVARAAPDQFRLWTFGWNNCLQWLFVSDRALDRHVLRRAVARLMRRHPALRLQLGERLDVQRRFMEAAIVMDLIRSAEALLDKVPVAREAINASQGALASAWPRWYTAPPPPRSGPPSEVLIEVECKQSEVEAAVHQMKKEFVPPFQLAVFRCSKGRQSNGHTPTYLCLMLSHAIADGSAVVPFLHDLGELCREEAAPRKAGTSTKRGRLPPHFGALLEERLLRTLSGEDPQEERMFLDRRMDLFQHHFPEQRCHGYAQAFHVLPDEFQELKRVVDTVVAGCPMEVALLSMLVLSLARVEGRQSVRITLVHHGRDHPPGAADTVGFFTDFRTFEVPTSGCCSLLGVLSFVASAVRERQWRSPAPLQPIDTLINIVPSPFERVGCFEQAPWNSLRRDSGGCGSSWPSDGSLWQSSHCRPLKRRLECQLEQVDAMEWNVQLWLDSEAFPPEKGQRLRACWRGALRDLREDPLRGVLLPAVQPDPAGEGRGQPAPAPAEVPPAGGQGEAQAAAPRPIPSDAAGGSGVDDESLAAASDTEPAGLCVLS